MIHFFSAPPTDFSGICFQTCMVGIPLLITCMCAFKLLQEGAFKLKYLTTVTNSWGVWVGVIVFLCAKWIIHRVWKAFCVISFRTCVNAYIFICTTIQIGSLTQSYPYGLCPNVCGLESSLLNLLPFPPIPSLVDISMWTHSPKAIRCPKKAFVSVYGPVEV